MSIKKTILTTFGTLLMSIFLIVFISARIAYIERTNVIQEHNYRQIQSGCLAALSILSPEDTASLPERADEYLASVLSGENYSWRIISKNDALLSGQSLSTSGSIRLTPDNTKESSCYYFQLPESDCYVILWASSSVAVAPLNKLSMLRMIFPVVILFFIAILLSFYVSRSITEPLQSLLAAIREASNGNLDVRCNLDCNNEIGELARNFNKMLHIISSNYEDLTSMHEKLQANEEELRKNYNHIEFLAYHDVLTQLPNKIAFYNKVYSTLSSPDASALMHAVYFVDLDNFKTINDTLGHDYGDNLLAQTASKLNQMIKKGDILSRAGGDEFLIFRSNISSTEEAIHFGEQVLTAFREPFNLEGEIAYISMSIGISIYPTNGLSHTVLIKNADIAMYRSKDTGKNKLTVFTSTMEDQLHRQAEVLECLRHVLDNNEVYLVYQPQFRMSDNTVAGYEALMRINSARLGPLSPAEFIPIAETNGLIYDLGLWALREACTMNKNLLDRGYAPRTVAVNLSSLQLNRTGFQEALEQILRETGLPPELLELELTESMLVSSITDASSQLVKLRSLGVHISLDDFGTGYSSLNYLARMPINTLKIDKSFIDNICTKTQDARLAESIISLAHGLNITVVAEGVEDVNQLTFLRSHQCDLVQGYLVSKPLLPEQLTMLLN